MARNKLKDFKVVESFTKHTENFNRYACEVARTSVLSNEEEQELAMRIQNGEDDARMELVKRNLRFAITVAKQYQGRGLSLEDLISEANIGMIKAANLFDPSRGFKFISYAVYWIRQQILIALSEKSRTIRIPQNKLTQITRFRKKSQYEMAKNGQKLDIRDTVSDDECAFKQDLVAAMMAFSNLGSIDAPALEDSDEKISDRIASDTPNADAGFDKSDIMAVIKPLIERELSDKQRFVFERFFGLNGQEPMEIFEIADKYNMDYDRLSSNLWAALKKLREPRFKKYILANL